MIGSSPAASLRPRLATPHFAPVPQAVRVAPSRQELRRADPSLSFHVSAEGARGFDVVVATDPALFLAEEAHRRTPKNFRSSRQDFQGTPIEIETGLYMLPRAFLREVLTLTPRPTRLHYVAIAYSDGGDTPIGYSVPPTRMGSDAPWVTLAGDLQAASLAKVMGMAVERVGALAASGRVMPAMPFGAVGTMPAAIGGLPVWLRRPQVGAPMPAPAPPPRAAPMARSVPRPAEPHRPPPAAVPPATPRPTAFSQPFAVQRAPTGFMDEDARHGPSAQDAPPPGFRDLDAAPGGSEDFRYDDGFGPPPAAGVPDRQAAPPASIPALDPAPGATLPEPSEPAPRPDAPDWRGDLVRTVIAEGAGGRFDALNLDGAFRGRAGPDHPWYQRAHEGLRIGPHQASQDSGAMGALLVRMRATDPAGFAAIFGPAADDLIAVTTAPGPSGLGQPDGRSPRVQPVAGADLWQEPWVERFRAALRHPPFQDAMVADIAETLLDPLLPLAEALGLDHMRGLAMLLSLAIHQGVEGAVTTVRGAINPFDTPARLGAVLDALGHPDLADFQRANGLPVADLPTAATHFALIAGLRRLGAASPVQVADPEAMMDMLVMAAGPGTLGDALLRLRTAGALSGAPS